MGCIHNEFCFCSNIPGGKRGNCPAVNSWYLIFINLSRSLPAHRHFTLPQLPWQWLVFQPPSLLEHDRIWGRQNLIKNITKILTSRKKSAWASVKPLNLRIVIHVSLSNSRNYLSNFRKNRLVISHSKSFESILCIVFNSKRVLHI